MNKVGKCYLTSTACTQYFSIIFNEKKCALYLIKDSIIGSIRLESYGILPCKFTFIQVFKNQLFPGSGAKL